MDLDGVVKVATGYSLSEALAWALLVTLWVVFVTFVVAVTLGQYWSGIVFPCRVIGVISVVIAGILGGALVLARSGKIGGKRDARSSGRSAEW